MTHFTVLVLVEPTEPEDNLDMAIEGLMAPFDEGMEVAPYDSTVYTYDDLEKMRVDYFKDDPTISHAKIIKEWEGAESVANDDGSRTVQSVYNPQQFELVVCGGGQGRQADQSARDEILREVFGDETARSLRFSEEEPRRSVHVLQGQRTNNARRVLPPRRSSTVRYAPPPIYPDFMLRTLCGFTAAPSVWQLAQRYSQHRVHGESQQMNRAPRQRRQERDHGSPENSGSRRRAE